MSDSFTTNIEINNSSVEPIFYVVSIKKFTILFLATLGLYSIYWFYKNWSLYRTHTNENIWPIPRSIFAIFFIHSLFRHIHEQIVSTQKSIPFDPKSNANALVLLTIVSNILGRAAATSNASLGIDILSLAMLMPLLSLYLKAQTAINLACDDTNGASNSELTTSNYIWIAIGAILWVLTIIGVVVG